MATATKKKPAADAPAAAKQSDDEIRAALELAHTQLLGEQAPDQVDDPLREWDKVKDKLAADAARFVSGQCLQHLPKSQHDDFLKRLKALL